MNGARRACRRGDSVRDVNASVAIRAVVRGRVQGVGFRDATVARAHRLGALGWVRNGEDGSVQVHAEGAQAAIDELAAFLHEGPPGAHVDAIDVERTKVEGHEQFAIRGVSAGGFVVLHHARGFELRLDVSGAVRAWAIPKEPSLDPAVKRFAIELPPGAPDAAPTWDHGTYEQGGRVPWPEALDRGHAVFVLHGRQLHGGFALQRTRSGARPQWLLVKRRDEHARDATRGSGPREP
jgi:acylphosphatase